MPGGQAGSWEEIKGSKQAAAAEPPPLLPFPLGHTINTVTQCCPGRTASKHEYASDIMQQSLAHAADL